MSGLESCPRCGREAKEALTSSWFPVHRCDGCGEKYCNECGDGGGTTCPECGSAGYTDLDKVYS